jgi:hypothetical protein
VSGLLEPIAEVFNLFNVTNVLGVSNVNYSGFSNVLVRDSNDPSSRGISAVVEFWAAGDDRGRCIWIGWTTRVSVCGTRHFLRLTGIKATDWALDREDDSGWHGDSWAIAVGIFLTPAGMAKRSARRCGCWSCGS